MSQTQTYTYEQQIKQSQYTRQQDEVVLPKRVSRTINALSKKLDYLSNSLKFAENLNSQKNSSVPSPKSSKNRNLAKPEITAFRCTTVPSITLKDFLVRFAVMGNINEKVFITAYVLIERAMENFEVSYKDLHKLLIASIFVSHKFLTDTETWFLEDFCLLSGIKKAELEKLDIVFCTEALKWNLWVKSNEYENVKRRMMRYVEW